MADSFRLQADATTDAGSCGGCGSGTPVDVNFDVTLSLTLKSEQDFELVSDAPFAVTLPGPTLTNPTPQASVVAIKATGKLKVTLTSADGAAQAIPVDGTLILISQSVPYTALSLTRVPGVDTFAHVFLGQI